MDSVPGTTHRATAIAIGSDGMPIASYLYPATSDLRLTHAANVLGVKHFRRR